MKKLFPLRMLWPLFSLILPVSSWAEIVPINAVKTHFISRVMDPNPQFKLGSASSCGQVISHRAVPGIFGPLSAIGPSPGFTQTYSWTCERLPQPGCLIYGPYLRQLQDRKGHLGGWAVLSVSQGSSVRVDITAHVGQQMIHQVRVDGGGGKKRIDLPLNHVTHPDFVEIRICDLKTPTRNVGGGIFRIPVPTEGSVSAFETGLVFIEDVGQ